MLAHCRIEICIDAQRLRSTDQAFLIADSSKLHSDTGWAPAYPIETTLTDMVNAWRAVLT
jgi:GDP-D-mannose dehydratase